MSPFRFQPLGQGCSMKFLDRFFRPPDEATFAKALIQTFRQAGDDRQATYDSSQSQVIFRKPEQDDVVVNLRNLFATYCQVEKGERAAWLKQVCAGLGSTRLEMPEDFEDVRPDLRPSVRSRSTFDAVKIQGEIRGAKSPQVPFVDVSEHMIACLVYDLPNSMRFVTQDNLDTWGVSLYQAMEIARQNLDESKPQQMAAIGDRLYVITTGDAYDGTRILSLDLIRSLKVQGQPVALPLTRDLLIVTGSDDEEGQRIMLDLADQNTDPRPLCSVPHVLDGDEWKPWRTGGSPHFARLRKLELQHFGSEYGEQKELLERRNEKLGVDVFVGSFAGYSKDGKDVSYCVWTKGVLTWLPHTDIVVLLDQETDTKAFIPWPRIELELAELLEPLDYYPPRWVTRGFPTPEQIQKLGAPAQASS